MVVLNILRRQKEKLLGQQISVDIKDPEADDNLKEKTGLCGFSYYTSLYLCLTLALMVALMCTSVVYFYDEYNQAHHFRGRCGVNIDDMVMDQMVANPMKSSMEEEKYINGIDDFVFNEVQRNFQEDFDIYLDEGHAKITVPNFRDGQRGQFIHDFNVNVTAIIDGEGQRCFVMPLDREVVLPPRSLMDMVMKMIDGYYDVNMKFVRQNMVVVIPPLSDLSKIGIHIRTECKSYPIYQLEKQTHAISKRSADSMPVKFREFAGYNLQEFDILNIDDVVKYEKELKNSST